MLLIDQPGDSCNLLIVEDDEDILYCLEDFLSNEGYHVFTAKNGQLAFEVLTQIPRPCLILLDLFMPIMNGLEFMEKIARTGEEVLRSISIVVVSAAPPEDKMLISSRKLATQVISKPACLEQILELANRYCRTSS